VGAWTKSVPPAKKDLQFNATSSSGFYRNSTVRLSRVVYELEKPIPTNFDHQSLKMAAVAAKGAPGTKGSKLKPNFAPNQTLYLSNLPTSNIQKEDLRISLYTLFSTYGHVLDVVAMRNAKMRGQAHITYRDVQTATQAMRALQKFEFFGRELVSLYTFHVRAAKC
jgi:RNA recognition motif-containing protein